MQSGPPTTSTQPIALNGSLIGGRYRVTSVLAEGGMGAVYEVVDERSGETLALKRLRSDHSRRVLALFEREYRTLAGLQHPRIIRAFDYGIDGAGPYYTMELAPGRDLRELAPLPMVDACRHLRDVATCLALLHTRRLLHRDITPRNVRVLDNGDCKLIDFGALTSFGAPESIVGTPPFIPPEALRRVALDQRADIYAFGALLYWTLTKKHAYPAKSIDELPQQWRKRLAAPSAHASGVSKQLDALVLSMLHQDPAMRPGTMADVVERLTVVAQLPPDDDATQRALAASYLMHSDFVGREPELATLRASLSELESGYGSATLVCGEAGVGRNRLLREIVVQAQVAGVPSVHVDARMYPQTNGVAVAIVQHLIDVCPAARREAMANAASLAELDPLLAEQLGVTAAAPQAAISGDWRARMQELVLRVVLAGCESERLLLAIDDSDQADDASIAFVSGLLRLTEEHSLALLLSAREGTAPTASRSWHLIHDRCQKLVLAPWSERETLALARSLFGDAPNLPRFAGWLHASTGGLPLLTMALVRRLHSSGEVRYLDGLWMLPAERPAHVASEGLTELLVERLDSLSGPALSLAQALAVERGALSHERCLEHAALEGDRPLWLIDELVRTDVLDDAVQGYRFSNGLLRNVLLERMNGARRRELHLRCAESELRRALEHASMYARVEAGWHFLQAGEESRGADELAAVAFDSVGVRFAFTDLHVAAPALESALDVYTRQGRHLYDRLPLMACLVQAGYSEDRVWAERYGEQTLAAMEEVTGLGLTRKLSPWLGKTLGLVVGMAYAAVRFNVTLKRVSKYGFMDVMVQLFGVVTTLTAVAAMALDFKTAERVAGVLEPFAHLPARLTPVGVAQFCSALKEICRENQASALSTWSLLIERFSSRQYYRTLPKQARPMYLGGLWFAKGVFEAFRDGGGALVAADALDGFGFNMYRMIASALRAQHHAQRGEFELARQHREQVDVHAIQLGSAWQVELWEPAALILPYMACADSIEMVRVRERLIALAARYPSLSRYAELTELAQPLLSEARSGVLTTTHPVILGIEETLRGPEPRSFIGWTAAWSYLARYYNLAGSFAAAKRCCEQGMSAMRAEDRQFVALYLGIELEHAVADAGLGSMDAAKTRLNELLALHAQSDNPLTRGRIHEACARTAAAARDWPDLRHHLEETRSWYRRSGTPALVALGEQLRALDPTHSELPPSAATVKHAPATREGRRRASLQPRPAPAPAADEPSAVDEDAQTEIKSGDGA